MKRHIITILLNILVLYASTLIFPGAKYSSPEQLALTGVILWLLTGIIKPILKVLTLPVTIITFGLFGLVLNTLILYIAVFFTDGLQYNNFSTAFLTAMVLSLVQWAFNDKKK